MCWNVEYCKMIMIFCLFFSDSSKEIVQRHACDSCSADRATFKQYFFFLSSLACTQRHCWERPQLARQIIITHAYACSADWPKNELYCCADSTQTQTESETPAAITGSSQFCICINEHSMVVAWSRWQMILFHFREFVLFILFIAPILTKVTCACLSKNNVIVALSVYKYLLKIKLYGVCDSIYGRRVVGKGLQYISKQYLLHSVCRTYSLTNWTHNLITIKKKNKKFRYEMKRKKNSILPYHLK